MAVKIIPDDIDLVVEPHELTPDDRTAVSKAIADYRARTDVRAISERALRRLASSEEAMKARL